MGEPQRCRACGHRPGPRSTGNVNKDGQPKKAPCDCPCHTADKRAALGNDPRLSRPL